MSVVSGRLGLWEHLDTAHPGATGFVMGMLRSLGAGCCSRMRAALVRRARIVLLAWEGVANTHVAERVGVAR